MDDMPQFYKGISSKWMTKMHSQLLSICNGGSSSPLLQDALAHGRTDSVLVGNAGPGRPAVELTHRTRGAPWIAGYAGTLRSWFDWKRLAEWATQLPEIRWQVVGAFSADIPTGLPRNVELLGPLPHQQVIKIMQSGWDVGLIPFLNTALTHAVDPVKYYEYRQCGLPVLSSKFGEMAHKTHDHGVWLMDELAPANLPLQLNRWCFRPTTAQHRQRQIG